MLFAGCQNGEVFSGNSYSGYDDFPDRKVSVDEAIKKAEPFLDKTFELRQAAREARSTKEPVTWVTLKENWYYIVKDNYPSYTPGFYLKHAVRINSNSGELIEPK